MSARPLAALLLLASIAHAQLDLRGQDIRKLDLTQVSLKGANMEGAILSGMDLSMFDLTGANLKNADLTNAVFQGTNLTGCDLRGARITGLDLSGATLTLAQLDGLDLGLAKDIRRASFTMASLQATRGYTDVSGCDFTNAILLGAHLRDAKDWSQRTTKWTGAQFDQTTSWADGFDPVAAGAIRLQTKPSARDLREGRFDGKDCRTEAMEGADLRDASLFDANLSGVNLRGANLRGADLRQADFNHADLSGADLRDAKFAATTFCDANLSGANLEGTNLKGMITERTILRGANLRNCRNLDRTTACDFSEADLRGALFLDAVNWGDVPARYPGALYNDGTGAPKGVDLAAVGAKKMDGAIPLQQIGEPIPGPKDPRDVGSGRDLAGVDMRANRIPVKDLCAANLKGAILYGADLQEMNLRFADLRDADLTSARLDGADLTGADLRGAKLEDAHLDFANFSHANLEGQTFAKVWGMSHAILKRANLRGVVGWPSNPAELDLREADLRGANLAGPAFDYWYGCRWRGAKYDDATKWPKGLDLEMLGVVKDAGDGVAQAPKNPDGGFPRLLAPNKPKGAPSEEDVKRLCEEELARGWGEKYGQFRKTEENKSGMSVANARYVYDYKSMKYEQPREVVVPNTNERRRVFGVHVVCDVTSEGKDGSTYASTVSRSIYLYQDAQEHWKLTLNEEGYDPPPGR